MPLKISIAMSRKKGERNYGSRGATVGLEMEDDSSLANQPQLLQERLAKLFELAKEAVDRQLEGRPTACSQCAEGATMRNGQSRPATSAQIRAIYAIGNRYQLDLATELLNRFGVEQPDDLTVGQASLLIDTIGQMSNGVDHHA
jgi:hypothetical protein